MLMEARQSVMSLGAALAKRFTKISSTTVSANGCCVALRIEHLTGLSRSSLYRLIAANEFPRPVNVSKNAVAWLSSSIEEWMAACIAAAQATQAKRQAC